MYRFLTDITVVRRPAIVKSLFKHNRPIKMYRLMYIESCRIAPIVKKCVFFFFCNIEYLYVLAAIIYGILYCTPREKFNKSEENDDGQKMKLILQRYTVNISSTEGTILLLYSFKTLAFLNAVHFRFEHRR